MLRIRSDQLAALEREIERDVRREYAWRVLRDQELATDGRSFEAILREVDAAVTEARAFGFRDREATWRLCRLSFLPRGRFADASVQAAIVRVLNNRELPDTQRMRFLERHVLPRAVDRSAATSSP
jgi:hypothetical protein